MAPLAIQGGPVEPGGSGSGGNLYEQPTVWAPSAYLGWHRVCAAHGKVCYTDKATAKRAARRLRHGLSVYRCDAAGAGRQVWHLGRLSWLVRRGYTTRDDWPALRDAMARSGQWWREPPGPTEPVEATLEWLHAMRRRLRGVRPHLVDTDSASTQAIDEWLAWSQTVLTLLGHPPTIEETPACSGQ